MKGEKFFAAYRGEPGAELGEHVGRGVLAERPGDAERVVFGHIGRAKEGVVDFPFNDDPVPFGRIKAGGVEGHLKPWLAMAGIFDSLQSECRGHFVRGRGAI